MGIDGNIKIKIGIFGAEPWTENMRKEIEKNLKIKAIDIYGLSEIIGPGVAYECECQNGLHVWEDHFIPVINSPITLEVLPYGAGGACNYNHYKRRHPLLRYRTRDITTLIRKV